jgi:hypothetical protein
MLVDNIAVVGLRMQHSDCEDRKTLMQQLLAP